MTDSIVEKAKQLLRELDEQELQRHSKLEDKRLAMITSQRASLKAMLRQLVAFQGGFEIGHAELLRMLRSLLALTRQYKDTQGKSYLSLKPGIGPRFQELLAEIDAYLTLKGFHQ